MKFNELDTRMRVFETVADYCVLPEIFMVARLDGRNFTRLTKEKHQFKAPYDLQFRDHMAATVEHLMTCGFKIIYGYTQSDEISLLLDLHTTTFNRKLRKLNSVLAGEASAKFSLLLGDLASFDCRISQLPNITEVVNYFRWRNEDASRNALNAHCYWCLRGEGKDIREATHFLERLSVADKNELLFQRGINFNDLPHWQKRGVGLYWEDYQKPGQNPVTGTTVMTTRRRIRKDFELSMKEAYSQFIANLIAIA